MNRKIRSFSPHKKARVHEKITDFEFTDLDQFLKGNI